MKLLCHFYVSAPEEGRVLKMKRTGFIFFLVFVCLPLFLSATWYGEVTQVFDGDTVVALYRGSEKRIRLHGVDCPEMDQPYGEAAKAFTTEMVLGKKVRIHALGEDEYGRAIARIDIGGIRLNEELVRVGLAWYSKFFSSSPRLAYLEDEARIHERGLWRDPDPMPPWIFRRIADHWGIKKIIAERKQGKPGLRDVMVGDDPPELLDRAFDLFIKDERYHQRATLYLGLYYLKVGDAEEAYACYEKIKDGPFGSQLFMELCRYHDEYCDQR
jgi:endonuclease YncB( thermonuclease family)